MRFENSTDKVFLSCCTLFLSEYQCPLVQGQSRCDSVRLYASTGVSSGRIHHKAGAEEAHEKSFLQVRFFFLTSSTVMTLSRIFIYILFTVFYFYIYVDSSRLITINQD